ncbi:MAG: hypothetical protein KDB04_16580 [Acidimicrobiales bacterium]|nr:hypothetical protein [Acidimicrobiales bacterium]
MGLDDRLGALSAAVAERTEIDAEGPLVVVHGRARRRRQRRRLVGASIAAAVVLAVGGIAFAATRSEDAERVTSTPDGEAVPPDGEAVPPPVDRSQAHLWLSAEQVPPGGADLAVAIVDPTDSGHIWGVAATVDRWDGTAWQPLDTARLCLDLWGCVGQIGGVDGVEQIGLDASPVSLLTWLRTGQLDPGWYRLTQGDGDAAAAGQFEVRADADPLPPAPDREGAHLTVEPMVLFASEALRRAEPEPLLPPPSTSIPSDLTGQREIVVRATGAPRAWQDGRVRLERWDGGSWIDASDLQVGGISPGIEPDDPVALTLADPQPGAYRVLVDADRVTIEGRFWVTDLE